jgi:hypothetical protein
MTYAISLLLASLAAQASVTPVTLNGGPNALLDVGRYEVSYQRGQEGPETMPLGWSGEFLPGVGISVSPWEGDALLLHCPWMNGTGPLEVRYPIALPAGQPISLHLEYAMAQGRSSGSDGVTYGVSVEPAGEPASRRVLLDQHVTSTQWTPLEADLSGLAGRTVDLVLRVGPGPRGDASFDFSLFRNVTITVGPGGQETLAQKLARVRSLRERYDAHPPVLAALANRADQGVVPSTGGAFTNRLEQLADGWAFRCTGEGYTLEYRLEADADLATLTASYDGGAAVPLDGSTGLTLADGRPGAWSVTNVRAEDGVLIAEGTVSAGALSARVTQRVRCLGKSLVVDVTSPDRTIASFTGPQVGAADWRRDVWVPYLQTGRVSYLSDQSLYVGSVLDWTTSEASRHDRVTALYEPLSDGSRIALRETAVVSVSPFLGEVLPNIPNEASPYREELARRVVVDDWMGDFAALRGALETYDRYGVRDLFVQVHAWQNGGYDAKLPDVLPANAAMGGDEEMIRLSQTAKRLGYRFGVHENYVDIYPDAASWDERLVPRDAKGEMIKAWYNAGTRIQSYAYRADAIVPTAERVTPQVHHRYGTTGAFIDVHSSVPPWFHVDFTAGNEVAGRFHPVWEAHRALWRLFREVHQGPVMGEGSCHFFWAGLLDGAEAQVVGGEFHRVLPDFDLLKIHPLVLNHGMGYYERWLSEGYSAGIQSRMALVRADKYRSQEILYGHAGFIGSPWETEPRLSVKEAWMTAPLQAAYGATPVERIEYRVAGQWVDASTALAVGETSVIRVTYSSGLTIVVNQSSETVAEAGRTIPPFGFVASGGGIREAYTAAVDGQVADFVDDGTSIAVDARGEAYHPGRVEGSLLPARMAAPVVEPTGPRQFRITYRWKVDGPVDAAALEGNTIFVHFVESDAPAGTEGIVFQGDHGPAVPFSEWREGQTIDDGPHTVTVPADVPAGDYPILVGIWGPGGRRTMLGAERGGQRYQAAVVRVAQDGTISMAEAAPPADTPNPLAIYDERLNVEKRAIDFGALVTSGAARLVREPGGAVRVYPLPQEVAFALSIRPEQLGLAGPQFTCELLDGEGKAVRSVALSPEEGLLALPTGEKGIASLRVSR